jgi:hypothetical protein
MRIHVRRSAFFLQQPNALQPNRLSVPAQCAGWS